MIKPDAVARGLEAEIIKRVAAAGLKVNQAKKLKLTQDQAADLYFPHLGKKFYQGLLKFITSGEVVFTIVEGEGAIAKLREIMGATDPREAAVGTIRGDLQEANFFTPDGIIKNLVHGSDSKESAEREIRIFF
ncbi:nucleoside-diphosphate kinase [Candidatus Margulisiibacteriota bacterium]